MDTHLKQALSKALEARDPILARGFRRAYRG